MLAQTPSSLSTGWRELTPNNWHYLSGGETVALVCKVGNLFYAEADRSFGTGRHRSRPLQLGRFPSKLAAMFAVQGALFAPSNNAASLGAAVARGAIAAPDYADEWSGFQSFVGY